MGNRTVSAEYRRIQPYVIADIRAIAGASAATGAVAASAVQAHRLDDATIHTGTLATTQAPWAVPYVVYNPHIADPDAHHATATVVAPVALSGQQISLSYAAPLTVVAGALDVALGDGVEEAGGSLRAKVPTNSGLVRDGSGLYLSPSTLTVATTNAVSGSGHTHAVTTTSVGAVSTIVALDANGYSQAARWVATDRVRAPLIDTASGNLTLQPAGDVILDPTGNDVLPATNYDINLGALAKKYLTLHAAELWVETLVAQNTLATIGGRILVGPTTTLTRDLATGDTTIYVKHNQMVSGDRVYMEADGKVEFLAITSGPTNTGSDYSYTVTRNLDGSGANQWYAGDAVFNTGQAGNGFIDLYSIRGVKTSSQAGPTIVGNVRNSSTFNDWSEAWAIGNLNGLYGYGANLMGVGLGKYASGHPNVVIDPTNGVRLRQYNTDMIVLDPAGNSYFAGVMTIGTSGEIRQGIGTLGSNYTGLRIWRDTNVGRIGGYNNNTLQWYASTDGRLYAGGGNTVLDADGARVASYYDERTSTPEPGYGDPYSSPVAARTFRSLDGGTFWTNVFGNVTYTGTTLVRMFGSSRHVVDPAVDKGFWDHYLDGVVEVPTFTPPSSSGTWRQRLWLRAPSTDLVLFNGAATLNDNAIWHAGNDGAGSGLDADTVDGYQASALALLAGASFTGAVGVGNVLTVTRNGQGFVLVGTDHSYVAWYPDGTGAGRKAYFGFGSALDDDLSFFNEASSGNLKFGTNGAARIIVDASGYVLVNTTSNTYSARLNVSGNIHSDAAITAENFLQLKQRSGSPGSASGFGRIYYDSVDDKLKYITSGGTVRTLSYT